MSGHSRFANIRHRKGAQDARRSRLFSRLSREITTAVTLGGSADPSENPRLRSAIASARQGNMPGANIQRAIQRAGGVGGGQLTAGTFEGFGPGGVGVIVETASDNTNRTVMRVRTHFRKHGGTLGDLGCLSAVFQRRGVLTVRCEDADAISLDLIDAGAEDILEGDGALTVHCPPAQLTSVITCLRDAGLIPEDAGLRRIPTLTLPLSEAQKGTLRRLVEALAEDDDVVAVYHNAA